MLDHALIIKAFMSHALGQHSYGNTVSILCHFADGELYNIEGLESGYETKEGAFFVETQKPYRLSGPNDDNPTLEKHTPLSLVERVAYSIFVMLVDDPAGKAYSLEIGQYKKKDVIQLLSADGDVILVTTPHLLIGERKV